MARKEHIKPARYHNSKRNHEPSKSINHATDKFNDQYYEDRDVYPKNMYRGPLSSAELYAGMEPRRRQELEDSGMIHEDHRAIANLPQEVMIKAYPHVGPYMPEILNDDVSGVDAQMEYDDDQRRRHFYPKKV